jgi:hypothetical protein
MATENGLYNIFSAIHSGFYPKYITRKFKTAKSPLSFIDFNAETVTLITCRTVREYCGNSE